MVITIGHDRSGRGKLALFPPKLLTCKYINSFSTANAFYLMKMLYGEKKKKQLETENRMKTFFSDCG